MSRDMSIPNTIGPASTYTTASSSLSHAQQTSALAENSGVEGASSSLLGSNVGVATISTASGALPEGVFEAVAESKPALNSLSPLEYAFVKDPENMMLYVGDMQIKLLQKGIVGAQGEIENNIHRSKVQRAIKQEKLEEQADELRKAQEAAKKAGVFGKLAGAFGISGGLLATIAGVGLIGTPLGPLMIAGGVTMMASSTVQTASPETYQKFLEYASLPVSLALQGMGMSESDAKMVGIASAQFCLSLSIASNLGPVGSLIAGVGGGVASGAAQVGMAASDIKAAGHQRAADELKAESEKFSKILALNKMDEETIRKFMKTMMDDINTILDTVMGTLQDTQASKQTIVNNLNQAQTV